MLPMSLRTAARVSETNLALYRTFAQPVVRALVSSTLAERMQQLHPLRLQYELFSNANPMMAPLAAMAEQVRTNRKPAAEDNPFIATRKTHLVRSPLRSMHGGISMRHWPSGCFWRCTARPHYRRLPA